MRASSPSKDRPHGFMPKSNGPSTTRNKTQADTTGTIPIASVRSADASGMGGTTRDNANLGKSTIKGLILRDPMTDNKENEKIVEADMILGEHPALIAQDKNPDESQDTGGKSMHPSSIADFASPTTTRELQIGPPPKIGPVVKTILNQLERPNGPDDGMATAKPDVANGPRGSKYHNGSRLEANMAGGPLTDPDREGVKFLSRSRRRLRILIHLGRDLLPHPTHELQRTH
ncbi:hypothetical protein ACOSQ3_023848 [Xanthoceras sorbifolium]